MSGTFLAASRYDRSANPEKKQYRFLTLAECKSLSGHAETIDRHGRIADITITSVKTWKTRPDVRIGWKFGLFEYGQETITRDEDNRFFVVEVNPS